MMMLAHNAFPGESQPLMEDLFDAMVRSKNASFPPTQPVTPASRYGSVPANFSQPAPQAQPAMATPAGWPSQQAKAHEVPPQSHSGTQQPRQPTTAPHHYHSVTQTPFAVPNESVRNHEQAHSQDWDSLWDEEAPGFEDAPLMMPQEEPSATFQPTEIEQLLAQTPEVLRSDTLHPAPSVTYAPHTQTSVPIAPIAPVQPPTSLASQAPVSYALAPQASVSPPTSHHRVAPTPIVADTPLPQQISAPPLNVPHKHTEVYTQAEVALTQNVPIPTPAVSISQHPPLEALSPEANTMAPSTASPWPFEEFEAPQQVIETFEQCAEDSSSSTPHVTEAPFMDTNVFQSDVNTPQDYAQGHIDPVSLPLTSSVDELSFVWSPESFTCIDKEILQWVHYNERTGRIQFHPLGQVMVGWYTEAVHQQRIPLLLGQSGLRCTILKVLPVDLLRPSVEGAKLRVLQLSLMNDHPAFQLTLQDRVIGWVLMNDLGMLFTEQPEIGLPFDVLEAMDKLAEAIKAESVGG